MHYHYAQGVPEKITAKKGHFLEISWLKRRFAHQKNPYQMKGGHKTHTNSAKNNHLALAYVCNLYPKAEARPILAPHKKFVIHHISQARPSQDSCVALTPQPPAIEPLNTLNFRHRSEESQMAKPDFISQLAEQASRLISQGPDIQQDMEAKLQVLLQSGFSKMNVVSRDEFDAQVAVLQRTRARVEALEKQLAELTAQIDAEQTGQ
ncbi:MULTISPECIES: accessory factor UbiK family protein [Spongiibacter]|uniref:accessory factor UbiK family protein n=1 Tax=Spongiibacter TaxID=630749 RepID=UPI0023573DF2|nr:MULTISPECIES: accessory factor UbiK family protein [Spongiibacter]|tara:strand:+ start:30123 stop:30743 length:621 start_codon:yes stop_codon:yes gene_type:complete